MLDVTENYVLFQLKFRRFPFGRLECYSYFNDSDRLKGLSPRESGHTEMLLSIPRGELLVCQARPLFMWLIDKRHCEFYTIKPAKIIAYYDLSLPASTTF